MNQNISFVLVRPVYLGNIGAAARVLKNFGFHRLRLVQPPSNYKDAEARRMAVAAFDVLKNAEVFPSLDEALKDVALAIGTTSGQQRDWSPEPIQRFTHDIVSASENNQVSIVIGDERNGLLREELERCHSIVTIPTNPEFPALNMSQAVAVIAYELTRAEAPAVDDTTFATGQEDDLLFDQLSELLEAAQFTRTFNRDRVLGELRQFYQRARPTSREVSLLSGALHRINQKLTGSRG